MTRKAGIVFVTIGAVLMILALLIFLYNMNEAKQAGAYAKGVLDEMKEEISDGERSLVLDGDAYIGYISISALDIELPVMKNWSYDKLKKAPCRHFGAIETDDLVIAAHNYESHFGRLSSLSEDDCIQFTDLDGASHLYYVKEIKTLEPEQVDVVQNSGYPLVLYSCTPGWGTHRVAVFCEKTKGKS